MCKPEPIRMVYSETVTSGSVATRLLTYYPQIRTYSIVNRIGGREIGG